MFSPAFCDENNFKNLLWHSFSSLCFCVFVNFGISISPFFDPLTYAVNAATLNNVAR